MKGHIRERSPGHWAIVIDIPDPKTGKRRRKWHSFKGTKRQAQTESARIISEFKSGNALEPSKITVAEYLDKWLEHIKSQVSPRTAERYNELARKNIAALIGSVALTKLTPMAISTAYSTALASGRRDGKGGLGPRTVHHCHRVLKQALAQAVRWQMLARNPADAVDPPKVERATMTTYDLKQTGQLIEAMRSTRLFVPTLLAVLLGMRRGEIAALRWRSVDLDACQLSIIESAEQMNGSVRLKPPKNGKGRTVALAQTIIDELRAHRISQAQELLKLGVRLSDDHFVCTHADGRMMQPTWITHEWVRLIRETGLPPLRFHDLRHAHASHMFALKEHPKVVQERLGHSSISITLDLYSHAAPGMQEDAASRVDAALQAAMKNR